MGKLIRDLIPELFPGTTHRSLYGNELSAALRRKLVEEAMEAWRSEDEGVLEELADVLEVLRAILAVKDLSWSELEAAAERKRQTRGGFERSLFAEDLEDGLEVELLNSPSVPLAPSLIDAFENERIFEALSSTGSVPSCDERSGRQRRRLCRLWLYLPHARRRG